MQESLCNIKLIIMKKCLLKVAFAFVLFIFGNASEVYALYGIESEIDYLNEFVELRNSGKDASLPLLNLKERYNTFSEIERNDFNAVMIDHISRSLKDNNKGRALAIIDLYEFLVRGNNSKMEELYFISGNIYAERCDTINLKKVINKLENLNQESPLLCKLNDFLAQFRQLRLLDKGLCNAWVSKELCSMKKRFLYGSALYGFPKYVFRFNERNDSTVVIVKPSPFSAINFKLFGMESQIVVPYMKDSIYIVWCSEKLKNYDPEFVGSIRGITGTLSAEVQGELSKRNKYDFGEQLAGSMLASVAEVGLNALFDAMFTPSKKIHLLEARLRRVSDNELSGIICYRKASVDASETNVNFNVECDSVTLYRWTQNSDVFFMGPKGRVLAIEEDGSKYSASNLKIMRNDTSTAYGKAYMEYMNSKRRDKIEFRYKYNQKQIEKLSNYNLK